jgi:hypothetical protein
MNPCGLNDEQTARARALWGEHTEPHAGGSTDLSFVVHVACFLHFVRRGLTDAQIARRLKAPIYYVKVLKTALVK